MTELCNYNDEFIWFLLKIYWLLHSLSLAVASASLIGCCISLSYLLLYQPLSLAVVSASLIVYQLYSQVTVPASP